MAKNWKVGEAVQAIKSGNKEDILDLGRRFPLFANLAAQVNEAGAELLNCVPEYVSARKLESVLKGDIVASEENDGDEQEEEVPEEKPAKPAKTEKKAAEKSAKAAKVEKDETADMTPKQLYDLCIEKGIKVKPKQPKEIYLKALKDAEAKAAKAAKAAKEEDDEEDWGDEEEEKPAKPTKTSKKAAAKEEDDDDDWNI